MAKNQSFSRIGVNSPKEFIVDRDPYHVILLIDSSGSMLFPYLKDEDNWNSVDSADYKQAVVKTQQAITEAHRIALQALRGSLTCQECSLFLTQYKFNSSKTKLNEAAELSSEGIDDVVILNQDNYSPFNGTALYNTIHEALTIIYERKIKPDYDTRKMTDKVVICVITDGIDTFLRDEIQKNKKIKEIKELIDLLRGDKYQKPLHSSVLIGLTSQDFTKDKLEEVREELSFNEAISINQSDEHAIRKAFKMASTEAAQP